MMQSVAGFVSTLCLLAALGAVGQDAEPLSGEYLQARWHTRLDGRTFVALIEMDVDLGGLREERELTVHRDDEGSTEERVLIRFEDPPELRKMSLLYFEHEDRPNDYFLYRPSVRRVRRLQEEGVKNNLYGVDPEFLGFGIARSEPTTIQSWENVRIKGQRAYRLEERASRVNPRFEERTVWLDAENFIPLRTEHRIDGRVVLVAETIEIREVQGIPTPVRMQFERPTDKTKVDLVVRSVDYQAKIPEETFSIFNLTRSRPQGAAQ